MSTLISSYLLGLVAYAAAAPASSRTSPHGTRGYGEIQWKPCGDLGVNGTTELDCGSLAVPLDYTEPDSGETLNLEILRAPAPNQPSKGSVFVNFGGPGASGVAEMSLLGSVLSIFVGGSYDVVNVVPRGTGNTLPFSCYEDEEERLASGLRAPFATNASDTALGEVWAEAKNRADACVHAQNETGSLIGTAFTARDIMNVVDALEEDGKLRWWGQSYGTLLGSTLIAMFPDKIDKAVLDGVINAHEYYHINIEQVAAADSAFSGFCSQCVDNKDICPIAGDRTAEELEEDIYAAMEALKSEPIPVSVEGKGYIVDYATIKGTIYNALYFPATWPTLAEKLDVLFSGNITGILPDLLAPLPVTPDADAIQGIKCSDNQDPLETLEDALPGVEARGELSKIGGDIADFSALQCARWGMPAKEQYTGDFKAKTQNPVLLVSTQHDPITPLVSAKKMSEGFEGSVVLEQEGYGHTIISQGSVCTIKAIMAYLNDGTLPEPGTVCKVDAVPFSGDSGLAAVLEGLTNAAAEE
ncbi:hypothetical protein BDV24DRAFT_173957 [Aspergillus arachidicola]|uniref:Peptidase S33 tripeptidyl aminopeptidase-like C-terminal domain-containing protein n=1 Tax=Aspergillus arachidicola TaxID=656916 RepID=A0A5N6YER1_9EURO|nr:hypothetical protein BDV24DRAFT_173957 [Aspergillus arachidicola]